MKPEQKLANNMTTLLPLMREYASSFLRTCDSCPRRRHCFREAKVMENIVCALLRLAYYFGIRYLQLDKPTFETVVMLALNRVVGDPDGEILDCTR